MWAPCLWDQWTSKDNKISFKSFAIITGNPPMKIHQMGHDRCPIFLSNDLIDIWLNPKKHKIDEMYEILNIRENVYYDYKWVD